MGRFRFRSNRFCFEVVAIPSARVAEFLEPDQADLPCPVPSQKIFRFARRANHLYNSRHPVPHRGAFRESSRTLERDAVDAGRAADESAALRTANACGPDASTPASSLRAESPPTVT